MKKLKFNKTNFWAGKGFYIALSFCLVAIAITVFFTVNSTINNLSNDNSLKYESKPETNDWVYPETEQVTKNENQIPKEDTEVEKLSQNQQETSNSEVETQTQPTEVFFALPVGGEIINVFSNNELIKSKTMGDWRTHDGIDIAADPSTAVKSAADGKVKEIKTDGLWGVCIIIEHNNGYTSHYYGLNASVNVKKGQDVKIGDVIGNVSDTAQIEISEVSHLHFGIKKDDKWIDPMSLIKTN